MSALALSLKEIVEDVLSIIPVNFCVAFLLLDYFSSQNFKIPKLSPVKGLMATLLKPIGICGAYVVS